MQLQHYEPRNRAWYSGGVLSGSRCHGLTGDFGLVAHLGFDGRLRIPAPSLIPFATTPRILWRESLRKCSLEHVIDEVDRTSGEKRAFRIEVEEAACASARRSVGDAVPGCREPQSDCQDRIAAERLDEEIREK